ncbi:MAG: 4-hydroxythreonine-4-phosphate dehydrogenase PdxA [Hormoscilla sp. GUM202]|nr:4-hydroxythreonine-4-phosphate dehydrogenase PdxA [Hormoscilla sp. GUM202]
MRPSLAITMGDPAGIGPEVILKALADPRVTDNCQVTVVGSGSVLQETYNRLADLGEPLASLDQFALLDLPADGKITPGLGNAASGAASFAYLETAIARTLAGQFQAIVTGPIAKSAWKAAGHDYPGQTELLADRAGVENFAMLFVARSPYNGWTPIVLLATTHIPLRQVPDALTPALLSSKLDLLVDCLCSDFGIDRPRIAIAGLNPHSGERGQLGREEQDWLIPWIERQRQNRQIDIEGPVPPDTLWVKPAQAWYRTVPEKSDRKFSVPDAYLALYHDQGLIPVKMLAFDRAVNTSIGLPFVRTSPDHGTAFDIAGKGVANATSMKAALQVATELAYHKNVKI